MYQAISDPRTATERVLSSPELLSAVFDVLEPAGFTPHPDIYAVNERHSERSTHKTHRATLAACARVSFFFSQHALDVLWRTIDKIDWLLNVLPTVDCVQKYGIATLTLTGDITASAWAHFQTFAVRIRKLAFIQCRQDMLIWTELVQECRGQPLLPNLRFLETTWATTEGSAMFPIYTLLCPRLQTICVIFAGRLSNGAEQFLFEALVNGAPQLETLSWKSGVPSPSPPTYLCGIDRHFPKLEKFTWRSLDSPIADMSLLRAISAMPSLHTLHLTINLPATQGLTFAPSAFESLHTLNLDGQSFRDVVEFASSLKSPALNVLLLTCEHDTLTIPTLHSGLSRLCANLPSTLSHFSLVPSYPHTKRPPDAIDETLGIREILGPLLSFKQSPSIPQCHQHYDPRTTTSLVWVQPGHAYSL